MKGKTDLKSDISPSQSGPLDSGDRSVKFRNYLDSIGINKEEMMAELEELPEKYSDKIRARIIALETYKQLVDVVKEWYKGNDGRSFTFAHMLQQ